MTRALPKFNGVIMMLKEELMKFSENGDWMDLKRMWWRIEDLLGYMNGISDDNNFGNAILIWGLVDPTPNGKKFGFRTRDMNSMVNSLGNRIIVSVCMQYKYSSIILDACICDHYGSWWGTGWFNDYVIELACMIFIFFLFTM